MHIYFVRAMVQEEGDVMGVGLRIVLVLGAVLLLAFVLNKIRRAQLQTSDAVFWFVLAGCLVILALFPQIAFWLADLLGVLSAANLIFLAVVAVLLVKQLMDSVQMARLRSRLVELTQEEALRQAEKDDSGPASNGDDC